jgi:hypothetical protein
VTQQSAASDGHLSYSRAVIPLREGALGRNRSAPARTRQLRDDPLADGMLHGSSDFIEAVVGTRIEDQALGLAGHWCVYRWVQNTAAAASATA